MCESIDAAGKAIYNIYKETRLLREIDPEAVDKMRKNTIAVFGDLLYDCFHYNIHKQYE